MAPGQFVMVSFPGSMDPLLPRAYSVCDADGEWLSLLYFRVGKGTTRLSQVRTGETVTMNGPLGRGFPQFRPRENVWCLVGGSGAAVAPILDRESRKEKAALRLFYGARTADQIVDFGIERTDYSTDDGSKGYHGTVVEMVKHEVAETKPDRILACGPMAMLKQVCDEFMAVVPTFISVETPMACGNGLCQGCPVKMANSNDYMLACKDGPVFEAASLDLGQWGVSR